MTKDVRVISRKSPSERLEQIRFIAWLKKEGFRCHHSPNGGKRHLLEAYNLKMMGVSKGFPDVFVPLSSGHYHSFFVEMKSEKGKLTEEQKDWIEYLKDKGFYAGCAHSFEEAKNMFLEYLSFTKEAA